MPIYEFRCPACDLETEKIVRMGTKTIICPNCGQDTERLVSVPAGFVVHGFSATNGYSGERVFEKVHKTGKLAGIRTKVTGRPEGFSDGLHK